MIKAEYLRFLQTLKEAPEPVRKIANLISTHLDTLIPLSTYQGQRIKRIVTLAQANWDSTSPEIQPFQEKNVEQLPTISKLSRMTVGPFRGFASQETFDLASRLVLIYGPNGAGKSSFCEALECGLLGSVAEAESKRFRDQNEYYKNAFVNQFSLPNILGDDGQGNEFAITPNESAYRFCFVEKNRIESFSRIAAQSPAKQTELIATLFGLDSFNDFVRNFSTEIDPRYIDLVGRSATILAQKQQSLSGAMQQAQSSIANLAAVSVEELNLANQYKEGFDYSQMILELNGNEDSLGLIERLETELRQPVASKSNLTGVRLEALGNSIAETIQELNKNQKELAAASQQVSFKQLYEAVSQVQPSSPSECPACKTQLTNVVVNPYAHASHELAKLQQLSALQRDAELMRQNIRQSLFDLSQIIITCLKFYPQSNRLKPFEQAGNVQPDIEWWNSMLAELDDGFTALQHLFSQVKALEEQDKVFDQIAQHMNDKQVELNRLREYSRQITVLQTRRQTANAAKASAQQVINSFQAENVQLIASVESEKSVVTKNQAISSAYSSFVMRLNSYFNGLPAQLVADLGESVVALYNSFNRNDPQNELLANVTLPLVQNQKLRISFFNRPNRFYDALHVLSEGHIRCLGLAILLAKNIKENAPLLIFDDPVNAIDDDHRESIRRTLFEDQYFVSKQILLTCHGEEFFKDIQNLLPAEVARHVRSFSFLPRLEERHIRVDFNAAPRNYILAARGHMNRNEIKDALAKSRLALESLAKGKVWRYASRYGDGNLSLKLRSPSAPIELRNLTEQLKSKIGKSDFCEPNREAVLAPIETLLGFGGDSREWRYLNKGAHEENDRAEFDRHTVASIITILETLDAVLA